MPLTFRTVFISDLHLGMAGCQAERVSRFLEQIECRKLYLVGDVIDMWWLRTRWHWPADHNEVVRRVLAMVVGGTEVVFVPGNHDGPARRYADLEFGGVKVRTEDIHHTADGRRLLITHGDEYEFAARHTRLSAMLGGVGYRWLVRINHRYNRLGALIGLRYWSLSRFVKLKLRRARQFIDRFEQTLLAEARHRAVDGVVCGHVHKAAERIEAGVTYYNCGDWLEGCTALVEHTSGEMEVVDGMRLVEEAQRAGVWPKTRSSNPDCT